MPRNARLHNQSTQRLSSVSVTHQFGHLVEELLQIVIADFIRETRDQGLCFFGCFAA